MGLAFNIPNTILIMMLPIPFIPTPRRLLLALLFILSILVFFAGIRSRILVLQHPTSPKYLNWYTSEASLSMIFANLPFLTSLVVATAPSRIRYLSHNLRHSNNISSLAQWPRSRLGSECKSWEFHTEIKPRFDHDRSDHSGKTSPELQSPVDAEKGSVWDTNDHIVHEQTVCRRPSLIHSNDHNSVKGNNQSSEDEHSFHSEDQNSDTIVSSPMSTPEPAIIAKRKSSLPKMRLSGGLAEMGDLSISLSEEIEDIGFVHS